ncbi:membrane fusion protein [Legionella birminghamensis]|uniref:Membrane-fusion protein n=1 Tax=Legionella birminghamensis TaxID=28083 RepID=A0A378IBD5_9GAMM|nr:efflux RND transporter periplasmic adaptor subunit [Legionella birminghamensis]KTC75966.1 membrane fusion protein [Legionella birminghamensis]STX32092.1 Membrane-fusion protein [Legionella birminghamensis]
MKRLPGLLRCVFCTMAFLFLISCSENENTSKVAEKRPVKAIQIGNATVFEGRFFPGKAKASQEVELSFNVNGSLIELPVKIGDKIKKGDLVAKLDPRDFEAKVKAAKAEFIRDKQNFQRAKELVGQGHISKSDYDLVESKWIMSQSNLELAEKAFIDSIIKAPFDGQIANLYVENYQSVSNHQPVARLLNISEIEMIIQIPESAISLMPHVTNIMVQFDAFPGRSISAQIKEISNEASPDTRTYPVTLILKQPEDIEILPGMAGKAKGDIKQKNDQAELTVPAAAVMTQGSTNKSYVWLVDPKNGKVHQQEVQLGELTSTGISVLKGIKAGDWLVIAGIHSLKDGDVVSILNQEDK